MLVLKLGGPKLLHAVSRAQGLPNLSITKERASCATFSVKDVFDLATLQLNLNAFSEIMAGGHIPSCPAFMLIAALHASIPRLLRDTTAITMSRPCAHTLCSRMSCPFIFIMISRHCAP